MHGVMQEPGPVVVPEMVVGIVRGEAYPGVLGWYGHVAWIFFWIGSRSRAESKRPTWASGRSSLSGAFGFETPWSRTSGLSPDPPWPLPARLAEPAFDGRFVPDAP